VCHTVKYLKAFHWGRLQPHSQNIRLGVKWLPQMNALAYLSSSSATKKKSFTTLLPGVNVIKPFSLSLTRRANKLECLSQQAFVDLSNILRVRPGVYRRVKHLKVFHWGRLQLHSLGEKWLPGLNALASFASSSAMKKNVL
jgi:hypothetical protein